MAKEKLIGPQVGLHSQQREELSLLGRFFAVLYAPFLILLFQLEAILSERAKSGKQNLCFVAALIVLTSY